MQRFQFHPVVARWFENRFESPTPPQEQGWPAIQSGAHTLIAAPTGSGKTLAAFLAALDELFRLGLKRGLKDETRIIYISPLKALSNDIQKNLEAPLAELREAFRASEGVDLDVRSAVRTGDTPASVRVAIARKPPHILVTTPESFYLLLTSLSGRKMLSTVRTLIVDEIHSVVGNRRGSHLALSMERLLSLVKHPVQRIGLSATQKPIEEVARFLVGSHAPKKSDPPCTIIDAGHSRALDLAIELPGSPLEAVMSNEVWSEVYLRLVELIQAHRTTLIFVNTRRMAERVAHQLGERLGQEKVASHHGSLSTHLRLEAENRLKRGELQALVATSSLELGIDIGSVDLVCQLGSTRSIATLLQRVGRAEHRRGGLPKGRVFPLTRDELVECVALMDAAGRGELDAIHIPQKPLDILAQQIVASVACEEWSESGLFKLMRSAYPYRDLSLAEFQETVRMLAEGFSTKRGRRAALIHHDAVNHRLRGRRGSQLLALTSGGAIPDNGDYRVILEPSETFIGTVNEDFAVESLAGDVFQLGNASWKILQIVAGKVRVQDAAGQPPGIPFWLGEAPARTAELSSAVAHLRRRVEEKIRELAGAVPAPSSSDLVDALTKWFVSGTSAPEAGARQLAKYFFEIWKALGVLPSQTKLVLERFFDESGGMQLVLHSPFGARINRAWGLALRKRFCRSFNFELQSAATDDAIVLSLGTQHSFALDEVSRYLRSDTVRGILIQALLDAPMFGIRWRWNATRSLALPRQRGGRKIAAPLQRMESENLLAAVFPDQLACAENLVGDREVPDHPLVRQTIDDCLTEAMDIDGLESLLRKMESGEVEWVARDLPEPSPLAHEILHARPYAFLDNAPLEERRTQAVYTRRASDSGDGQGLGILDPAAIARVCEEAWPRVFNPDELHEALLQLGVMSDQQLARCGDEAAGFMSVLIAEKRAGKLEGEISFWTAAERLTMAQAVYPKARSQTPLTPPDFERTRVWETPDAFRELVRGQIEVLGPVTVRALADFFQRAPADVEIALLALESEGFVLRGKFNPHAEEIEWCDRRLLARIHRMTLNRLRAEIQPVSLADFQRFLFSWQRVAEQDRVGGPEGLEAVLALLDGFEVPASRWETAVLAARVSDYAPQWMDRLCLTGRIGWGRLSPPHNGKGRGFTPLRSSPMALFARENLRHWLELSPRADGAGLSADTETVHRVLEEGGALFFSEIVSRCGLLKSRVEQALGELAAVGRVTADSFEGLRALLVPSQKRAPFGDVQRKRRHRVVTSIEFAGRWSLLRAPLSNGQSSADAIAEKDGAARDAALEVFARGLLRRYGVVFRRLLERESLKASWFELGRIFRKLEARGEIRGGYFVNGASGEQFALPEAVGLLRSLRSRKSTGEIVVLSAADPLNLLGILSPGPRVAAIGSNRILWRDGEPLAALEGGRMIRFSGENTPDDAALEQRLRIGKLSPALRTYYN